MQDLIRALQIMLKYGNPHHPTVCAHDVLYIVGVDPSDVSEEDKAELDRLGFFVSEKYGDKQFQSFRFGSA